MKETTDDLVIKDSGKDIKLSTTREINYSYKEYLEVLEKVRAQREQFKQQIPEIQKQLEKIDGELKKLEKHEDHAKTILTSGIKNKLAEHMASEAYKVQTEETYKAWLFSRPNLMEYAPNSLLREVIWELKFE